MATRTRRVIFDGFKLAVLITLASTVGATVGAASAEAAKTCSMYDSLPSSGTVTLQWLQASAQNQDRNDYLLSGTVTWNDQSAIDCFDAGLIDWAYEHEIVYQEWFDRKIWNETWGLGSSEPYLDTTASDFGNTTILSFGLFRPERLSAGIAYNFAYEVLLPNNPASGVHSINVGGTVVEKQCRGSGPWCVGLNQVGPSGAELFVGPSRRWSVTGTTCWAWIKGGSPAECSESGPADSEVGDGGGPPSQPSPPRTFRSELVRNQNDEIYWVNGSGVASHLLSMQAVECWGGSWTDVSQATFDGFSNSGGTLDCADRFAGEMVRDEVSGSIAYVNDEGTAHPIGNMGIVECFGDSRTDLSPSAFESIPSNRQSVDCGDVFKGQNVLGPDGSIVYVNDQGTAHPIGNMDIVECFGDSYAEVSQAVWSNIPNNGQSVDCGDVYKGQVVLGPSGSVAYVNARGTAHPMGNMDIVACFGGIDAEVSQTVWNNIPNNNQSVDCGDAYKGQTVRTDNGAIYVVNQDGTYNYVPNMTVYGCLGNPAPTAVSYATMANIPNSGENAHCGLAYAGRMVKVGRGIYYVNQAGRVHPIGSMSVVNCLGGSRINISSAILQNIPHAGSNANCSTV